MSNVSNNYMFSLRLDIGKIALVCNYIGIKLNRREEFIDKKIEAEYIYESRQKLMKQNHERDKRTIGISAHVDRLSWDRKRKN